MRRARKLFDSPRVLKSSFNAYVLSKLEYCFPAWILSAESHLSLPDSVVRSAESLCGGELFCLWHRKCVSALCLFYNFLHTYLHHFVATRNSRDSAALCELALVILSKRNDQFSRLFLPFAVSLWNWLSSDVFCRSTLSSFKSAINLCLHSV